MSGAAAAPASSWARSSFGGMRSAANKVGAMGGRFMRHVKSVDIECTMAMILDVISAAIMITAGVMGLALYKTLHVGDTAAAMMGGLILAAGAPPAPGSGAKLTPAEKKLKALHAASIASISLGALGFLATVAHFSTCHAPKAAPKHAKHTGWMIGAVRLAMGGAAGALGGIGLDVIVEQCSMIGSLPVKEQHKIRVTQAFFSSALAVVGAMLAGFVSVMGNARTHAK